jgi:3-methyl-2-oxobutanoate hydroxymethyltransferase
MAETKPAAQPARKKVTIPMLVEKMKKGEPIVQLAVYDYETAIIADRVGIDILCVSDTGGMVLFGHEDTTSVSFEEVMFMAQAVKRGSKYGLRMVDMPYMSFHLSAQQAVDNAAKYVSQGGAEVMKCEGNQHHAKYIEAIVKAGIPVQGHIGITPMRMPQLGGFFAQGKTAERAKELVDDAQDISVLFDSILVTHRMTEASRCPPVHLSDVVVGQVIADRIEVGSEAEWPARPAAVLAETSPSNGESQLARGGKVGINDHLRVRARAVIPATKAERPGSSCRRRRNHMPAASPGGYLGN